MVALLVHHCVVGQICLSFSYRAFKLVHQSSLLLVEAHIFIFSLSLS